MKTMLNTTWNCVISFEVNDAAAFVYREPEPRGGYSIIPRKRLCLELKLSETSMKIPNF